MTSCTSAKSTDGTGFLMRGTRPPAAGSGDRPAGAPARGAGGRPGLGSRSGEQVVQIAVHAMVHHGAHQIKGALLGIARGAGVTEHVIGDAVHVGRVSL